MLLRHPVSPKGPLLALEVRSNHPEAVIQKSYFFSLSYFIKIFFCISITMPNPITNQVERNIAEGKIIKDIRNIFRLKKNTIASRIK